MKYIKPLSNDTSLELDLHSVKNLFYYYHIDICHSLHYLYTII